MAIKVRQDIASIVTRLDDLGEEDQEIIWVNLKKNNRERIFIGTYYGKQKNVPEEEIETEYAHLRTQINTLSKQSEIIITGDFNAKIAINKTTI